MDVGAPDKPNSLELTVEESSDTSTELGIGAFAAGEQTDAEWTVCGINIR